MELIDRCGEPLRSILHFFHIGRANSLSFTHTTQMSNLMGFSFELFPGSMTRLLQRRSTWDSNIGSRNFSTPPYHANIRTLPLFTKIFKYFWRAVISVRFRSAREHSNQDLSIFTKGFTFSDLEYEKRPILPMST